MGCFDCKSTKNLRAIHTKYVFLGITPDVVSTAKVQKIWEQFTPVMFQRYRRSLLFRLQKYKKFESNSHRIIALFLFSIRCFDCKSTKNLRAIHTPTSGTCLSSYVVSTAKVQKIWEQFTPAFLIKTPPLWLFRLQKYKKFESNSHPSCRNLLFTVCCFDCKSTKNLRAIHTDICAKQRSEAVVSTAKVQKIWEQFTPYMGKRRWSTSLFRLQKYKKFESNSHLPDMDVKSMLSCFDCKSTKNLRAIHT